VERLHGRAEAGIDMLKELNARRDSLGRQEASARADAAAAESARAAAEREHERIARDRTDAQGRRVALDAQIAGLSTEAEGLTSALEAGQTENEAADDALAALNEETRELAARRDSTRSRTVAVEVDVVRLQEKREGLARSLAGDKSTLEALQRQREQKSDQRSAAASLDSESGKEREILAQQLRDARTRLSIAEAELAEWRERGQALQGESAELAVAVKAAGEQRSLVTKGLHDAELRIARLEVQAAQATERLLNEYSISRDEALARPDDATLDRNTTMEVQRLRRELRAMGQVNTGAVGEYERLTERYEFLAAQRADLETGRLSLLATIAEIDDSTRGVFMETFEAVRTEFDSIFTRLFDGGATKLILTSPDDLLDTGIEIIAQPPGKKAQLLSLLSGGERALTATALLFAFLAVKPSPFVLLDEVDAPLDGANVEKFTRLVRDFSGRSQFLLITHNPVTMEAAPTWYGVTMKEPGISSVLSYRVPAESLASEPEAAVVLSN
jgi:chromosome segregation protein